MIDVDQIRQNLTHAFEEAKVFDGFFDEVFEEMKDDINLEEGSNPPRTIQGFKINPWTRERKLNYKFNNIMSNMILKYDPKYEHVMPYTLKDFDNKKVIKFEFRINDDIKIHMWQGFYHLQYQLFDYLLRVRSNLTIDGTFLKEDFPLSKDIKSWTNQDLVMLRLMS